MDDFCIICYEEFGSKTIRRYFKCFHIICKECYISCLDYEYYECCICRPKCKS